ncbi:MAG: peptidase S1 [Hyphomonadaceae bacterium]|nr:peptidase S1 [Hyphomonadaceae bacterium]
MTSIKRFLAAGVALLAVAAGAAQAQDFNAAPNYGTLNLTTGFSPDPAVVNVTAGGELNAANLSSSCRGSISNAPDVRLNFRAGSSLPLIISVASSADTTLVVNGPDGSWYCDDDGGVNGLNPALRFNSPMSGRYEIWVGSYGGDLAASQLHVSEVSSQ